MRKLLVLLALAMMLPAAAMFAPGYDAALAKGDQVMIIGGGDLAPYFYAMNGVPFSERPLGLNERSSSVAAPADARQLLAGAFDLYFPFAFEGMAARTPAARYVPAAPGRPAYVYWEAGDMLTPGAWYLLGDEFAGYLERARAAASGLRTSGGAMETDPVAEYVLHARSPDGRPGLADAPIATYVVATNTEFRNGVPPLARITGTEAAELVAAYIESLHHVIPSAQQPRDSGKEYYVYTPEGAPILAYLPAEKDEPARVRDYFSTLLFAAAPDLERIMSRALGFDQPAPAAAPAPAADRSRSRWSSAMIASIAGAGIIVLLSGSAFAVRRRRGM